MENFTCQIGQHIYGRERERVISSISVGMHGEHRLKKEEKKKNVGEEQVKISMLTLE